MATKNKNRSLPRTALENIGAAGLGTAVGYGVGALGTKLLLTRGPYARRLAKLSPAERLQEIRLLRGAAGATSTAAGGLAGLAARQRLRKARKKDKLTRKLGELR